MDKLDSVGECNGDLVGSRHKGSEQDLCFLGRLEQWLEIRIRGNELKPIVGHRLAMLTDDWQNFSEPSISKISKTPPATSLPQIRPTSPSSSPMRAAPWRITIAGRHDS